MFAFYLFVVTSLSLIAFYIGMLVGLGDLANEAANDVYWVSWIMVIRNISYALVAAAIWFFHLRVLREVLSSFGQGAGDLLRFYLISAAFLLVTGTYAATGGPISGLVSALLNVNGGEWTQFQGNIGRAALSLGLLVYHWRIIIMEFQITSKAEPAAQPA